MIRGEPEKNSGLQVEIKPTTFRTLVGCSNQWDTENSWVNINCELA